MMCLESDGSSGSSPGCGGRLRAGDEEEEEDGERGCCGRGAEGEVQTLSGRMNPPAAGKHPERPAARHKAPNLGRARVAAAGILSVGNVLNYLDRYTVAGVLLDIQQHFGVKDSGAGLLQTVFICSFMVAAPIFGYLGDRFNRKIILSCGIFFWSAVTFSSSFITEQVATFLERQVTAPGIIRLISPREAGAFLILSVQLRSRDCSIVVTPKE